MKKNHQFCCEWLRMLHTNYLIESNNTFILFSFHNYTERFMYAGKLTLIDLEYSGKNYPAFDIGCFFCEFAGMHVRA